MKLVPSSIKHAYARTCAEAQHSGQEVDCGWWRVLEQCSEIESGCYEWRLPHLLKDCCAMK